MTEEGPQVIPFLTDKAERDQRLLGKLEAARKANSARAGKWLAAQNITHEPLDAHRRPHYSTSNTKLLEKLAGDILDPEEGWALFSELILRIQDLEKKGVTLSPVSGRSGPEEKSGDEGKESEKINFSNLKPQEKKPQPVSAERIAMVLDRSGEHVEELKTVVGEGELVARRATTNPFRHASLEAVISVVSSLPYDSLESRPTQDLIRAIQAYEMLEKRLEDLEHSEEFAVEVALELNQREQAYKRLLQRTKNSDDVAALVEDDVTEKSPTRLLAGLRRCVEQSTTEGEKDPALSGKLVSYYQALEDWLEESRKED